MSAAAVSGRPNRRSARARGPEALAGGAPDVRHLSEPQTHRPPSLPALTAHARWSYLPKSYDDEAGGDPEDLIKVRAPPPPRVQHLLLRPLSPRPRRAPRPRRSPALAPAPAPRADGQRAQDEAGREPDGRVLRAVQEHPRLQVVGVPVRCVDQSRPRGTPPPLCTARRPRAAPPLTARAHRLARPLCTRSGSNMGYGCSLYKAGSERIAFEGCRCAQYTGSLSKVKK